MKLQNNSAFQGVFVIVLPVRNLLKSHGFIEVEGSRVAFTHLQKHDPFTTSQELPQQPPANSLTAVALSDPKVDDLVFTFDKCTRYQESGDGACPDGDA